MYKAIYREYRPEVFSSMLGQEHIVKILKNQIANDQVNHAYLFCGTRGTGKTTTARLLAKAVNCLSDGERPCGQCANCKAIANGSFVDLIEIDAASNNGIEDAREIRDSVEYAPMTGRKKVYIIDEVHMLSKPAFNALLKTLEEPPATVMFILCTTEPEKLPQTILSRCMRMDFRRVSESALTDQMKKICEDKGVEMDEGSVRLIAANADGSVRDGLTLLEQCIAGRSGKITRGDVLDSLGTAGEDAYIELTRCVLEHDTKGGLLEIAKLIDKGLDPRQLLRGWMNHYRNLMLLKFVKHPEDILNMSLENVERVRKQAELVRMEDLDRAVVSISQTLEETRLSQRPRILMEVCFVRLASTEADGSAAPAYRKQDQLPKADERYEPEKPLTVSDAPKEPPREAEKAPAASDASELSEKETGPEGPDNCDDQDDDYMMQVWDSAVENCEQKVGGMFSLVRQNVVPVKMNAGELVVAAKGMAKDMLGQHVREMEEFLTQASGSPKRLIIHGGEEKKNAPEKRSDEQIAEDVSRTLGIDHVDIVDE